MKIIIDGIHTILQTMNCEDSQSIIDLRNQPVINQYLSSSVIKSLDEQNEWMTANLPKRDGLYLKILDKKDSTFCGTISLYNIENSQGELGRYICTKTLQAIEAELLIVRFAFDIMKLQSIYCRTAELNSKVWHQHYGFGFIDYGEELLENRNMKLKKQILSEDIYLKHNYSKIEKIINTLR